MSTSFLGGSCVGSWSSKLLPELELRELHRLEKPLVRVLPKLLNDDMVPMLTFVEP